MTGINLTEFSLPYALLFQLFIASGCINPNFDGNIVLGTNLGTSVLENVYWKLGVACKLSFFRLNVIAIWNTNLLAH